MILILLIVLTIAVLFFAIIIVASISAVNTSFKDGYDAGYHNGFIDGSARKNIKQTKN